MHQHMSCGGAVSCGRVLSLLDVSCQGLLCYLHLRWSARGSPVEGGAEGLAHAVLPWLHAVQDGHTGLAEVLAELVMGYPSLFES